MFSFSKVLGVKDEDSSLVYRTYFAFFCSGMMSNIIGSVLPFLRETYGFDYAFQGTLSSVNQIGNLCAVWLSGFLPYAIGRKNSTLLMGSGIVIGLILMTLTGNPLALIISFIIVGAGRGTMSNITNVVVGQYAGNKSTGLNLLHATFAVGAVISPSVVAALGPAKWRVPLISISILMALALFLMGTSTLSNKREKKVKGDSTFPVAFSFWLNTFIMFFYLCCEASLMNWLVTYFKDSGIFSNGLANMMSAFLWIMILTGRLICAYLANRVNKSLLILILGVLLATFFIIMITATSPVLIFIGLLGIGLSMSGIYPTTLGTQEARFTKSTIATGTCIGVATLGSIIMPIIIGNVAKIYGIKAGMATITIALMCMIILMIVKLFYSKKHQVA